MSGRSWVQFPSRAQNFFLSSPFQAFRLLPHVHPLAVFPAHISSRRPHDLNACNGLFSELLSPHVSFLFIIYCTERCPSNFQITDISSGNWRLVETKVFPSEPFKFILSKTDCSTRKSAFSLFGFPKALPELLIRTIIKL